MILFGPWQLGHRLAIPIVRWQSWIFSVILWSKYEGVDKSSTSPPTSTTITHSTESSSNLERGIISRFQNIFLSEDESVDNSSPFPTKTTEPVLLLPRPPWPQLGSACRSSWTSLRPVWQIQIMPNTKMAKYSWANIAKNSWAAIYNNWSLSWPQILLPI